MVCAVSDIMHRVLITIYIYATLVCTNNLLTRGMDAHKGDSIRQHC